MRIFSVSISPIYESDPEKKKAKIIRRDYLLQECGVLLPVKDDDPEYFTGYASHDVIVTGDQLLNIIICKIDHTVKNEANIEQEPSTLMNALSVALDKLNNLNIPGFNHRSEFNEKVDVHMPGNLLMSFNETLLIEDSCTDVLQDSLNNGWRVVAVCPQPDQRRPDYILGRYNPSIEVCGPSAARSPK